MVFAHGLEGSPEGIKVQALRAAGLQVVAPDGRGKVLAERLVALEEVTRGGVDLLGGSSYGGLAAAWLAATYPERFKALLLLAPALHYAEAPATDPGALIAPVPTIIIHGTRDAVVPIDASRRYRDQSGPHVQLWEVDDEHVLVHSLDKIAEAARLLIGAR